MFVLGLGAAARAQDEAAANQPAEAQAQPAEAPAATGTDEAAAARTAAPAGPVNPPQFGVGFQARYISLPSAFLAAFLKASRPLSSWGVGFEGFRRKRDADNPNRFWELSLGVGYQSMSPPDGNWLGNGHAANLDTDWVQFKNVAFWTIDFSFVERQFFNEFFGIHYGAGLGLTIIQGDILRTSSSSDCTDSNLGDTSVCRPRVCTSLAAGCTESELKSSQGPADTGSGPGGAHRFREGSVPGAIPALSLFAGIDFRVPQVPGLEFRVNAGFFDLLVIYVGGGVAYLFP
jgi:hypothetical protein